MNLDVIAEIIATSFNAARPALRRYSCSVILHSPDKTATPKNVGYGGSADGALNNAIHNALRYELMHAGTEVHVSSRTLPDGYGVGTVYYGGLPRRQCWEQTYPANAVEIDD